MPSAELKTPKNEKTRFAFQRNGFSRCGGKSLHEVFKGFASDEFDRLGGFDFYHLASAGITAFRGIALAHFKRAEAH